MSAIDPIADIRPRGHLALMVKGDKSRLSKLLTESRLKKRASILIGWWASVGVSVSPVAPDRYWLLLNRLRVGRSGPLGKTSDILAELRAFSTGSDMLTVIGWDVDEEPALLIGAEKLIAKVSALDQIYPDGFILISDLDGKALLVDFDYEAGPHVNSIDLPTSGI